MFLGKYNKSLVISYVGVICSVLGMYYALIGYFKVSMILLILAGICDMLDGKFARMCKRDKDEEMFGIQLDSLADTVNFVVLPVILMLSLGMTSLIDICVYMIYSIAI